MIDNLVASLSPTASWIVFASCKSVAVIALVLLCRRLLARWLSAQGRHGLWFALIACLSVPFGLQVNTDLLRGAPQTHTDAPPIAATLHRDLNTGTTISFADPPSKEALTERLADQSIWSGLILAWLGVSLVLLTVTLWNLARHFRTKARATEVDAAAVELFLRCKEQLNLRRRVLLLESPEIKSPAVFGWWSPTLLLPTRLTRQLSPTQLRYVFMHELTHVRRQDILINWLAALVQIVHWFNPAVWYGLRKMRADMEQACDADVMRHLVRREQLDYGDTLIRLTELYSRRAFSAHGAGIVEDPSELKGRITMIAHFKPKRIQHSLLATVMLLAITSAAITQPLTKPEIARNTAILPYSIEPAAPLPPLAPLGKTAPLPTLPFYKVAANDAQPPTRKGTPPAKEANSRAQTPTSATREAEPLLTDYLQINYAKASDLAALIKSDSGIPILSNRGSASFDERTNTLLIRDTNERVADIRKLVATLDVRVRQVQLEVRIAIVNEEFSRDLSTRAQTASDPNNGGARAVPPGRIAAMILGSDYAVDTELSAMEAAGRGEVITAPRVVTANQRQATISQGIEIPYSETTGTATGRLAIQFKEAQLSLNATPQITPDNRIIMDLEVIKTSAGQVVTLSNGNSVPPIDKRRLVTQMLVNDGQTVLLGGIMEMRGSAEQSSTAPSAGNKRELLIFVTPKQML